MLFSVLFRHLEAVTVKAGTVKADRFSLFSAAAEDPVVINQSGLRHRRPGKDHRAADSTRLDLC